MTLRSPCSAAALALLWLAGCDSAAFVGVDVITDLRPGEEVTSFRVELDTAAGEAFGEPTIVPVAEGDPFLDGVRVAEYAAVPFGEWRVRVLALDGAGMPVIDQVRRFRVSGPIVVPMVITRDCADVSCPALGDSPDATYCRAGRCVECLDGRCGADACTTAAECAPMSGCAEVECVEGACLYAPNDDACGDGFACSPERGCEPFTVALTDLPPLVAAAVCEAIASCDPVQKGTCLEDWTANITDVTVAHWQTLLDRGTAAYDAELAAVCIAEIARQGCAIVAGTLPASCAAVMVGSVPDGGSCTSSFECAGGRFCDVEAACPGACRMPRGEGEPCMRSPGCLSGLVCESGACAVPVPRRMCLGPSDTTCPDGETCVGGDGSGGGVCTPLEQLFVRTEGQPCAITGTAAVLCVPGLACRVDRPGGTGTCGPRVGSGEACVSSVPDMCPDDESCYAPFGTGEPGTCGLLPTVGEACRTPLGLCVAGARCVSEASGYFCRRRARLGEPCVRDGDCVSVACRGGLCVSPAACPTP